jgi:glycosyltransferase involved in cell wall biosynthesis
MHFRFDSDYVNRARQRVAMLVMNPAVNDSRVLKTAQTVSKLGFQVCLYGMAWDTRRTVTRVEGYPFDVLIFPHPRWEMERLGKWTPVLEDQDWDGFINILVRYLREQLERRPPDILHTHDMGGLTIGGRLRREAGKSSFPWIHDIHEYVRGGIFLPKNKREFFVSTEEEFIHSPDALISVAPALNEVLQGRYSLPAEPALVLNTPRLADFDPYFPSDVRAAVGVSPDVPLLVYIGHVKDDRDIPTLAEALPMLPEVHLAIVTNSSGRYVWDVTSAAQKVGVADRIHFLPYVPFYNVTSFLRTATIGIHSWRPHPNADLGVATKIYEYIHAGVPSVVSDNRVMKEFVEQHDCGVSFKAGDASSLAEAVTRVLDRLRSQPSWRQSIQALSEQYSWEVQEPAIADVYEKLAGRKGRDKSRLTAKRNYRVLHLSESSAGQPSTIATVMKQKGIPASSIRFAHSAAAFQYQADLTLEKAPTDLVSASQVLKDLVSKYDIFHYHVRPLLFSSHFASPTGMDMIMLRATGKKVFFHFHGSEARLASVFQAATPHNNVVDNPSDLFTAFKESEQRIFLEFVKGVCNNVLVPDPELQSYVSEAVIVPRVVDLKKWTYVGAEPGEVLRVVHSPARRGGKGTEEVLSVIEKLRSEGTRIELRLVENVANEEAREIYKWADVVIDQLKIGWYGILSVETMALGKAVVCYIRDDLKHYLPYPFPLALANPDNLYYVLKNLTLHPEEVRSLGERGRKYVEELHDAEKVTDILLKIYEAEGNTFDIGKAVKLLSFQSKPVVRKPLVRKLLIRKPLIRKPSVGNLWIGRAHAYINKRNFVAFFGILRHEGVRVAVGRAYDLFFR